VDLVGLLAQALDSGDVAEMLRSVLPRHPQYLALKRELARYREMAARDASALDRVARIELNLERWRWLPEELASATSSSTSDLPDPGDRAGQGRPRDAGGGGEG